MEGVLRSLFGEDYTVVLQRGAAQIVEQLRQDGMSVTQYEIRLEMVRSQERGEREAKRPRGPGGFSGILSGGQFYRGMGRSYINAQTSHPVHRGASPSHGSYSSHQGQPSLGALPAQSSSRAPSVQGSFAPGASSIYSGSRGPIQSTPPPVLGSCFECHELGHMWSSVALLGHIVPSEGITVDPKKIETVQSWHWPSSATEIQSFLGLVGYYRSFVEVFSSIASPLTKLTHKGALFRWSDECEKSFQKFKTALITAPVLVLPSASGSYTLYFDASRIGIGYVLM
ncbi:uncharacterized protein [Nicotiana tomentosiformis]|uniref:uncharacterized protein n=1 Tax=Nicotiana tomentosiformis TaxID=4098 RepID=UPI00388CC571